MKHTYIYIILGWLLCLPSLSYGQFSSDCEDELWYRDADGDGYGHPFYVICSPTRPTGYIKRRNSDEWDCNDTDGTIHPGAPERCDGKDNDCDLQIDEDPLPGIPATISVSNQCGKSVLTRGNPPGGITWYWQSSASGTSTSYYSTSITRTSGSSYYLRARDNSTRCWGPARKANYSIKAVPGPPSASVSNQCGRAVLTRGNPPSGVTWYWQSSSSGTSTSNASKTINRTSGSQYYLRARHNTSGCWSSIKTVNYSIKAVPTMPAAPSVSNSCGKSVLTRGNAPNGISWHWQSSASGTDTSFASTVPSLTRTSGSRYYLRARNTSTGCWSTARTVNYSIKSVPEMPALAVSVSNQCGKSVLTRGNPPSGVTWYWQNSVNGTIRNSTRSAATFTVTSGSRYYLRGRNNTTRCWGPARAVDYNIKPLPATPSGVSVSNQCGKSVLTRNNPPSGVTWYWQSNATGTSTANSNTSITRTSGSTYYLRARNNSNGCWGNARTVNYDIEELPPAPQQPGIAYNCGNTVLTKATLVPLEVTTYWQSSPTGTSTANANASITLTSGSVYYLRNKSSVTGCWSPVTTVNYSITSPPTWYKDGDGDGFASTTKTQCGNPGSGYSLTVKPLGDCNDNNAAIHPNTVWHKDSDGDGFASTTKTQCGNPGSGYSLTAKPLGDCNDSNGAIHPNTKWYADTDNDSFGDPNTVKTQCEAPAGYVLGNNQDQCPNESGPYNGCRYRPYQPVILSNENYVYTKVYQTAVTAANQVTFNKDVIESVAYYDGLGRPKQQVAIKASPDAHDIITHIQYDALGRQAKEHLPFTHEGNGAFKAVNITNDINSHYLNTYAADFNGITDPAQVNAYSESVFEASPLNRVLEQGAPGKDWKADPNSNADHTIKFDWDTNTANEVVRFEVAFTNNNTEKPTVSQHGFYAANELQVTITKDENWTENDGNNHTTREYKDKLGRVILKRTYNAAGSSNATGNDDGNHDTYYVYDDYGNLTYVIPPKVDVSDGVSAIELAELCYQYKYDYRNRLIEKKIPGKGWEYIIYNKLNQIVMTQDANQRKENSGKSSDEWLFTKYDAFGRVAYTGIIADDRDHSAIQDEVNALTTSLWVESSNAVMVGGVTMYYDNGGYPNTQNAEVLSITYYDDYDFLASEDTFFDNPNTVYGVPVSNQTKSLITGTKVKTLNTSYWTTSVSYFDNKARQLYAASRNEYLNTTDVVATKLDFVGKIEKTKVTHKKGNNAAIITEDVFEYDHMGRVIKQTQIINGQEEVIAENSYDELGQLVTKKVGGGLQEVDYTYNVRGWLQKINDDAKNDNDIFDFKIAYNNPTHGAVPLFSGNISETEWKTTIDNTTRWYAYDFDALNRLTTANSHSGNFDVSNITYDKMGNILSLDRVGHLGASSFGSMDMLTYEYAATSNKLLSVTDGTTAAQGFNDVNKTNDDYDYDANGNMILDQNKGISGITYNHLNLPETVSISNSEGTGTISYIYDATGTKLSKIVTEGSSLITEYAGNYVYKNGNLEFFNHSEGIVEKEADGYKYVYQFKDHLDNIRLSYKDANKDGTITQDEIVQEKNYYPFGLEHRGYNNTIVGREHPYKFQGVELEESLDLNLYEMDWRQYDPAIGRFISIDPLAEERNWLTPYNFVQNNPIIRVDPSGLLDDYGIDRQGNITLLQETDDTTDTLYAVNTNENGETVVDESRGSVTVNKEEDGSSILSQLSDNTRTETWAVGNDATEEVDVDIAVTDEKNKNDVFKVFKFAADNSNVEWSVGKIEYEGLGINYQIGTYHKNDLSPGIQNSKIGNPLGLLHSHPNQPTAKDRSESLFGDKYVGRSFLRRNGSSLPYLIYFPDTKSTTKIGLPKNSPSNGVTVKRGLKNYKF
ncbi:DUF6443 domain-containing protein [Aquimarina gracilis]|uniref:DUF6443 domain-containing protein n=1 Tax=Aquimarina gracilis TaxID=874422 RepID=A0ABU5ZVG3_9FLAO|nr:DUF6443 domain-containing protein [Aquimarina gracilis]MEB3345496.1 DUF6443 domain-containing protein [Aquimarina gracilis]